MQCLLISLMLVVVQDSTLQVVNHTRVFALGDTSSQDVDVANFPATAQVAFQQADYVAWNLWASINGRALLSFRLAVSCVATNQCPETLFSSLTRQGISQKCCSCFQSVTTAAYIVNSEHGNLQH